MLELVEVVQKCDFVRIKVFIDFMCLFFDVIYIIVGDVSGQCFYYVNFDEIGKLMEGGDSDEVLINVKSYVLVCKGLLGLLLCGKLLIQDVIGKVIGIVLVGYIIE